MGGLGFNVNAGSGNKQVNHVNNTNNNVNNTNNSVTTGNTDGARVAQTESAEAPTNAKTNRTATSENKGNTDNTESSMYSKIAAAFDEVTSDGSKPTGEFYIEFPIDGNVKLSELGLLLNLKTSSNGMRIVVRGTMVDGVIKLGPGSGLTIEFVADKGSKPVKIGIVGVKLSTGELGTDGKVKTKVSKGVLSRKETILTLFNPPEGQGNTITISQLMEHYATPTPTSKPGFSPHIADLMPPGKNATFRFTGNMSKARAEKIQAIVSHDKESSSTDEANTNKEPDKDIPSYANSSLVASATIPADSKLELASGKLGVIVDRNEITITVSTDKQGKINTQNQVISFKPGIKPTLLGAGYPLITSIQFSEDGGLSHVNGMEVGKFFDLYKVTTEKGKELLEGLNSVFGTYIEPGLVKVGVLSEKNKTSDAPGSTSKLMQADVKGTELEFNLTIKNKSETYKADGNFTQTSLKINDDGIVEKVNVVAPHGHARVKVGARPVSVNVTNASIEYGDAKESDNANGNETGVDRVECTIKMEVHVAQSKGD